MLLFGNENINWTSLEVGRRARLLKWCLKHSSQNKVNDPSTWKEMKIKATRSTIPRESVYRERKVPRTYRTRPFLAQGRFHLSIIVFFFDEPPSEPHLRTVLLAGTIDYSPWAWRPWRLGANVWSSRYTEQRCSWPQKEYGSAIFFTRSEGPVPCVLNSTPESKDFGCSKIKRKMNATPASDLKNHKQDPEITQS